MNVRKEVELIVERNITERTRVNHFSWDPCATSTPVRKPLYTLNNLAAFGFKQCDALSSKISFKAVTLKKSDEVQNCDEDSTRKITKKNKTRSRHNSFYPDYDDEEIDDKNDNEGCLKDSGAKKNLIIKLGSDQVDKTKIKDGNTGSQAEKAVSPASLIKEKNERKRVTRGRLVNGRGKQRGKNKIKVSSPCEGRKDEADEARFSDTEIIVAAKKRDSDVQSTDIFIKDKNCSSSSVPNTIPLNEGVDRGNTIQKRKTAVSFSDNVISKKLKNNHKYQTLTLDEEEIPGDNAAKKLKSAEIVKNTDKSKKENKTKLSTSHEIFSENKERELKDSLDLTNNEYEVLNENAIPNQPYISLHKKKKCLSKKKASTTKTKFKSILTQKSNFSNENQEKTRPKRIRNSPKEFWLPRSSDDSNWESNTEFNFDHVKKTQTVSLTSSVQREDKTISKTTASNGKQFNEPQPGKDLFKDIAMMEFTEMLGVNKAEVYSHALGWKFPLFKCGALKIGKNCEVSSKTGHENSYFGGVLLVGRLLMKIEDNEKELKAGQMFCVPPLTSWKAVNVTTTDCALYYWSGRF